MNREAALFVFYKVSSECPPAAAEQTLKAIFKAIRVQPALLMTHAAPRLTATTCRVIGNYARDVLRNPANASTLEFAIRYFLYVLEHSKGSLTLLASEFAALISLAALSVALMLVWNCGAVQALSSLSSQPVRWQRHAKHASAQCLHRSES